MMLHNLNICCDDTNNVASERANFEPHSSIKTEKIFNENKTIK